MTKEGLENKCTERAKIFQQAMENCKSSNPMDCIEWFADRILELEKVCQDLSDKFDYQVKRVMKLEKENAELKEKLKPENCLKLLAKDGYVKFTSDQLTEAKEIIKALLKHTHGQNLNTQNDFDLYLSSIKDAEQFLEATE